MFTLQYSHVFSTKREESREGKKKLSDLEIVFMNEECVCG